MSDKSLNRLFIGKTEEETRKIIPFLWADVTDYRHRVERAQTGFLFVNSEGLEIYKIKPTRLIGDCEHYLRFCFEKDGKCFSAKFIYIDASGKVWS